MLVSLDQINESIKRYNEPSISKSKDVSNLSPDEVSIINDHADVSNTTLSVEDNLLKRKEMLAAVGAEPVNFAFERAIGNNDSVYSNFCELIMYSKQRVCRVVIKEGNENVGFATGFMVSERLLLTNWHVFRFLEEVGNSEVDFYYEFDMFGRSMTPTVFKLVPEDFFYSFEDLDYCLVAVDTKDITGNTLLSSIGYHYLDPNLGKLGEEGVELLNIIHHPGGDYQQLSIRENQFTKILANTIWYKTDTAQGSSGSPVFNDQWQVVALHHMGVPLKSDDGKNFLDKDGNIIEIINNKVDISRIVWIANEGIRISVLLSDIFNKYPNNSFVEGLKKKPTDIDTVTTDKIIPIAPTPILEKKTDHENNNMENNDSNNVQISFPASLIETNGNITININNKLRITEKEVPKPINKVENSQFLASANQSEDLLEVQKIAIENSFDYSNCTGYDETFLGTKIPIPRPKTSLIKFVAKLKNSDDPILRYYYFSTIHHSVRKMPMISAINVNGDLNLRKDKTKRVDVWLRDNRLDYDMQLDDKFYASSGFDKGHMSRREDADWGLTEDLAKKYADLTCIYTNACPQVPKLNRSSSSGLWGILEKLILEKGVEKENGKFTKISVFNGPIFSESDRFYKGVQIPMKFWKIVVWFNENNALKATGFMLSQGDLVSNIPFDEKLDFDSNKEFQSYQCSIKSLEELTNLDFSSIAEYDTYKSGQEESFKINSEADFGRFIDKTFSPTKEIPRV